LLLLAPFEIADSLFTGNSAVDHGGAVFADAGNNCSISACRFEGNAGGRRRRAQHGHLGPYVR
jgi:predicted outer membrane repeat protein